MAQHPRQARSWRRLSAFPLSVPRETAELLDTVGELLAIPETGERRRSFHRWLDAAEASGVLTREERTQSSRKVDLTLHESPEPMYLAMFLNGDDDLLYEEAERERILERGAVRSPVDREIVLRAASAFIVVRRTTKREGIVVESSLPKFRKGSVVRCATPWAFAVRPRNGWSQDTFVAPRTLALVDLARRPAA